MSQSFKNNCTDQPSHRIINATVTRISMGRIYLDRIVGSDCPTASTTDSQLVRFHDAEVDSGYGSSNDPITKQLNNPHHSHIQPSDDSLSQSITSNSISWDFLVYALGSQPSHPLQLPSNQPRTKLNGVLYLQNQKERIAAAEKVVVVGGGALGIQYATDIAHRYKLLNKPKSITLIHSRARLMPLFKPEVHAKAKAALEELGVRLVLGERVDLRNLKSDLEQQVPGEIVTVRSLNDPQMTWEADLVLLCSGQVPNTRLMAEFCPLAVPGGASSWEGLIKVKRTLQLDPSTLGPAPIESPTGQALRCECASNCYSLPSSTSRTLDPSLQRVFAIGDCTDAFGAIKAGHTGWNQAEIAAKNIVKLANQIEKAGCLSSDLSSVKLDEYHPGPPMIKLTLGLNRMVTQLSNKDLGDGEVEVEEKILDFNDRSWTYAWVNKGISAEDVGDGWD
ncbi:hypothetical protein BY996DRAFT_7905526 [Phakopsora pachyrhizi]|nr:hypothetical protein BY996DRAFT_7905526 [Phakopsora pachyrhizi]